MNRVASIPVAEQSVLFAEAAERLQIQPVIVEKDFWVCWMLGLLFGRTEWSEALVFKGATRGAGACNRLGYPALFHVAERNGTIRQVILDANLALIKDGIGNRMRQFYRYVVVRSRSQITSGFAGQVVHTT